MNVNEPPSSTPSSLDPVTPAAPPWRAGLEAARANAVPGVILSVFAVGLLLSYWYIPAVNAGLERLGQLKLDAGWPFVAVSTALFGGLIPGLAQKLRPSVGVQLRWKALLFILGFWAYRGLEIDLLYRLQAMMFGHGSDPATLIKKVAFDMLVYSPLWALPTTIAAYSFAEAGLTGRWLRPIREHGVRAWITRELVPLAISNWAIWVPAVSVIYCLPLAMQLPVQNLVLCFWSLMLVLQVGAANEIEQTIDVQSAP